MQVVNKRKSKGKKKSETKSNDVRNIDLYKRMNREKQHFSRELAGRSIVIKKAVVSPSFKSKAQEKLFEKCAKASMSTVIKISW